ncbi:hypothetical protein BJ508DRAFT_344713 [Ascobolus immersus RN42]|uniref:Uncharacterized protein n=1 Tax=Ascobolus immersus RN42 TaxID=1160509 RepID=A0A3N4I9P4_ASCIM|nr:hypothetical protein BJ508DRAFT_344713 [Ascobolus immersus RN42]
MPRNCHLPAWIAPACAEESCCRGLVADRKLGSKQSEPNLRPVRDASCQQTLFRLFDEGPSLDIRGTCTCLEFENDPHLAGPKQGSSEIRSLGSSSESADIPSACPGGRRGSLLGLDLICRLRIWTTIVVFDLVLRLDVAFRLARPVVESLVWGLNWAALHGSTLNSYDPPISMRPTAVTRSADLTQKPMLGTE